MFKIPSLLGNRARAARGVLADGPLDPKCRVIVGRSKMSSGGSLATAVCDSTLGLSFQIVEVSCRHAHTLCQRFVFSAAHNSSGREYIWYMFQSLKTLKP